ncbi:MFS transporter [Bacilliculturomica massiliensis]|uniref:MFS transporter n=1 Tax=Bacilliculturomica massiliensis TaxID=1917867 RepID=UPI001031888A|nr:MFS transporter [Bacilliculturomica massiliensis]
MKEQNWKNSVIRFLTAQTISLFGSSIVQYAIVWYITLTTSSGKMLTLSTACGFLPQILISLFAGVWIDRYDRKKLIMISDTVIAAVTLLLAVSFMTGHKSIWLLFCVLAVRSAGTGIQTPAVNAVIPQMVPQEQLMKINGIQSALSSLMMFLSPAVSGAVLSVAPLEAALLIDVITAAVGVGITAAIPIRPHVRAGVNVTSYIGELRDGLAYLKENGLIRRLLVFQLVVLFLISPSAFLTPLMVSRSFGTEVWRLTASEMTYSLGMILGGILIAVWGGFREKIRTVNLAGGLYGLLMIGLGTMPVFSLYLLCNGLIGITSPCYNGSVTVIIQEKAAPEMHGRVFSFMQIASSCSLPLGMMLFGPLADVFEVQNILITAGTLVAAVCALACGTSYFSRD